MKTFVPALLLLSMMLIATPAVAASETVDSVLEDQRLHAYPTPAAAIARLQAASDRPDADSPLDLRRRYDTALVTLSIQARLPSLGADALAELDSMATNEGCVECRVREKLARAMMAGDRAAAVEARAALTQAESLAPHPDKRLQLQLLVASTYVARVENRPDQAIKAAVQAGRLADELGSVGIQVELLLQRALMNTDLGDLDRAKALLADGYALAQRYNYVHEMAYLRLNEGHVDSLRNDREGQRRALTEALRLAGDDPGLAEVRMLSLSNPADYYLYQGDNHQALEHARRANYWRCA